MDGRGNRHAYSADDDRLVILAEEMTNDDNDDPAQARFTLCREQVVGFIDRARDVVSAGRPCPYCGSPQRPATGTVAPASTDTVAAPHADDGSRSASRDPIATDRALSLLTEGEVGSSVACRTRATQLWSTSSTTGSRPRASTSRCEASHP